MDRRRLVPSKRPSRYPSQSSRRERMSCPLAVPRSNAPGESPQVEESPPRSRERVRRAWEAGLTRNACEHLRIRRELLHEEEQAFHCLERLVAGKAAADD